VNVAIVHDWLTGMRGGEKVLKHVLDIFPGAHLYTIFWKRGSVHPDIEKRVVHTSFLDRFPLKDRFYRYYLPLYPFAVEAFDLRGYDLVISISHCAAKGVITPPYCPHISYVLTPMRYAWVLGDEYFGADRMSRPFKALLAPVLSALRTWDAASSHRVDHFITDSLHVKRRVTKFYRRNSTVVYPPVEVRDFYIDEDVKDYYLYLGSFAPYKRADLAIEACRRSGRTLYLIGTGQDEKRLKKLVGASRSIRFLGWLEHRELVKCLAKARAIIFPGEEDFGIVPLEALACGRPVLAYGRGGVLETITGPGESDHLVEAGRGVPLFTDPVRVSGGVLFPKEDVSAIINGMDLIEGSKFDPRSLRDMALGFRPEVFREKFKAEVERCLKRAEVFDA